MGRVLPGPSNEQQGALHRTSTLTHPASNQGRSAPSGTQMDQTTNHTTMKRTCVKCGRINCEAHKPRDPNLTRNPARDLNTHKRWARKIKHRDHHTCQRCGARPPLVVLHAHHTRSGYTLDAGITLCRACHMDVDALAR